MQKVGDSGPSSSQSASSSESVVASAGEELELECLVSGGNPPAKIRWFAGEREVGAASHSQENSRSSADARKWISISRLRLPVSKEDNGEDVR